MKKLILTACAVACVTSVFAQGTVVFNNKITGTITTHVYLGGNSQRVGNGSTDSPAGAADWTGYVSLTGSSYWTALLAANGANVSESSLSFGVNPTITTFKSGGNAGAVVGVTATLGNVLPDAANATLEMFVWDRTASGITDPAAAWTAWNHGLGGVSWAAGASGTFNVSAIGGVNNLPPTMPGGPGGLQSFNIYTVPEPATMALAGLGAAAMLIFRRRK